VGALVVLETPERLTGKAPLLLLMAHRTSQRRRQHDLPHSECSWRNEWRILGIVSNQYVSTHCSMFVEGFLRLVQHLFGVARQEKLVCLSLKNQKGHELFSRLSAPQKTIRGGLCRMVVLR